MRGPYPVSSIVRVAEGARAGTAVAIDHLTHARSSAEAAAPSRNHHKRVPSPGCNALAERLLRPQSSRPVGGGAPYRSRRWLLHKAA